MTEKLKIGVLGAGHLGSIHLRLISEMDSYLLAGVFDIVKGRAVNAAEKYNTKVFNSVDELIKEVDVVDIVTPTLSHFHCAIKAIEKSKHCFIEKPLTSSLDEAEKLKKSLEGKNIKIQVGHVERFNPAFVAAQPYCCEPMFIEVHRLAEFNPRGTDVSVVYDLMIHDIDIILTLLKAKVKNISANGVAVVSNSPDIANARIEFENGCVANLTASRISMKNMRKMRLFQKDAYISMDFLEKNVEIIRIDTFDQQEDDPFAIVIDTGKGLPKKKLCFQRLAVNEHTNAIRDELESFANSILKNLSSAISLEDGINALRISESIVEEMKV